MYFLYVIIRIIRVSSVLLFIISCNKKNITENTIKTTCDLAAIIDNKPIYLSYIDKSIKQELYDELYRIYIIRKTAINEIIKDYVLTTEAKKFCKSKDDFIEDYYKQNITDSSFNNYSQRLNLDYIPDLKRTLKYYDIKSEKGKALLLISFKNTLLERLVDSLKSVYKPKIFIEPPLPPKIGINNIPAHYRGNMESKITLLEVSDMECDKCREFYPVYQKLYNKYKDQVRFGFTHFASYVTLSAIATECAGRQDKFWEMHDSLMKRKLLPDTVEIFDLAEKIKLNIVQFKRDFTDFDIQSKIEYNFRLIEACGLFATPTILINGKPVFNSSSEEEIEKMLKQELQK